MDLNYRDKKGWSLVFRAIAGMEIDLVKFILSKMKKTYSGTTMARITVEEENIMLLVNSGMVDWDQRAENEDPSTDLSGWMDIFFFRKTEIISESSVRLNKPCPQ